MQFIINYSEALWSLTLEMSPWLVLGLLFAGILNQYFPKEKVQKHLGKSNLKSVINASVMGIPLPLCSCGVIPTGISFHKNGASKGATNSFLISTPQTGVDSILATYSLMGWVFAIIRPLFAFITGVIGGVVTNCLAPKNTPKPQPSATFKLAPQPKTNFKNITPIVQQTSCSSNDCCTSNTTTTKHHPILAILHYAFIRMLSDIGKWLFIGLLLAALISALLPNNFFSNYIGSGLLEIIIILLASIPLYVCATGSIPIATVLLLKGVSPGAAIAFLMAGPATNIATITVVGNSMGRKSLIAYLGSIIGGAIIFGLLTNYLIPKELLLSAIKHGTHHSSEMLPYWFSLLSTIVLILFLLNATRIWFINKFKKIDATPSSQILKVEGMTCNHCKNSVETNLLQHPKVKHTEVNLANKTVSIIGTITPTEAEAIIKKLGFRIMK